MQVGGDEIAERSPEAIKRDFRALGRLVEGSGAQVVFSSIPSVAGNSTERDRKTHQVNRWLRDCGAIGQILASFITARCTQHRACW